MRTLIISSFFFQFLLAQTIGPELFRINQVSSQNALDGLRSNSIGDIIQQEDTLLWLGTGAGLSLLKDSTSSVKDSIGIFTLDSSITANRPSENFIGAVSALAVEKKTLLAAFAISGEEISAGNGIVYSSNSTGNSITWKYFYDELIDKEPDSIPTFAGKYFKSLPITAHEANVTYDAAIEGSYAWITSWAGGLRRYNIDIAQNFWERIPLPQDGDISLDTCDSLSYEIDPDEEYKSLLKNYYLNPRDPEDGGNHNHKAFSVIAYSDTIWVGTANGINRGIIGDGKGCVSWKHFTPSGYGLSGGFVVDLELQRYKGKRIIWAATVQALNGEKNGVSFSMDDGETWHTTLVGERAYNISASDSIVLVATKTGLWKTVIDDPMDIEKVWAKYSNAKQVLPVGSTGAYKMDEVLSDEVVGVNYDKRSFYSKFSTIWLGTWDGLARSIGNDAKNWRIYRSEYDKAKAYAYPNPFSPYEHNIVGGGGYVHINIDVKISYVVKMDIFNFAMEPVLSKEFDRRNSLTGSFKWDGKDKNGRIVDNGTYFIKMEYDQKVDWLKLIVIK